MAVDRVEVVALIGFVAVLAFVFLPLVERAESVFALMALMEKGFR